MKNRSKTQAVPDIRGLYQNKGGDRIRVLHKKGDIWRVKDALGQEWTLSYESVLLFLETRDYERLPGL